MSKLDYEYGPFGEVIRATGPAAKLNPIRFSSKYDDDESDFLYYGHRYYNPSTGRWLSRDPFLEDGFLWVLDWANVPDLPTAVSEFTYVGNDPENNADYLGAPSPPGRLKAGAVPPLRRSGVRATARTATPLLVLHRVQETGSLVWCSRAAVGAAAPFFFSRFR